MKMISSKCWEYRLQLLLFSNAASLLQLHYARCNRLMHYMHYIYVWLRAINGESNNVPVAIANSKHKIQCTRNAII